MRDVAHNKLTMLVESMLHDSVDGKYISELQAILREERLRGFRDGDRDMRGNLIIYTLSPDDMPDDIESDTDFNFICKNVAGSHSVIEAVSQSIEEAAEYQRLGGLQPPTMTDNSYRPLTYHSTAIERRMAEVFEKEISALTGKKYPADFTPEFVSAKNKCDQTFLDLIATDSMNASDEISNTPRAEYLYKQCLSHGGSAADFAPMIEKEVVQTVYKLNSNR